VRSGLLRCCAGFSHGTLSVTGSLAAAQAVYQLLQIFFNDATFSKYKTDDFALWTEVCIFYATWNFC
jgi:hypothetical protein